MSIVIPVLGWVYVYQRGQANIELRYTRTTGWQICLDGQNFLNITILKTTVVSKLAIFLHFHGKINPRYKAIMIANDSLSANDYRRLMVKLKIT
jgi:DNA topoisomerase VI subunit A